MEPNFKKILYLEGIRIFKGDGLFTATHIDFFKFIKELPKVVQFPFVNFIADNMSSLCKTVPNQFNIFQQLNVTQKVDEQMSILIQASSRFVNHKRYLDEEINYCDIPFNYYQVTKMISYGMSLQESISVQENYKKVEDQIENQGHQSDEEDNEEYISENQSDKLFQMLRQLKLDYFDRKQEGKYLIDLSKKIYYPSFRLDMNLVHDLYKVQKEGKDIKTRFNQNIQEDNICNLKYPITPFISRLISTLISFCSFDCIDNFIKIVIQRLQDEQNPSISKETFLATVFSSIVGQFIYTDQKDQNYQNFVSNLMAKEYLKLFRKLAPSLANNKLYLDILKLQADEVQKYTNISTKQIGQLIDELAKVQSPSIEGENIYVLDYIILKQKTEKLFKNYFEDILNHKQYNIRLEAMIYGIYAHHINIYKTYYYEQLPFGDCQQQNKQFETIKTQSMQLNILAQKGGECGFQIGYDCQIISQQTFRFFDKYKSYYNVNNNPQKKDAFYFLIHWPILSGSCQNIIELIKKNKINYDYFFNGFKLNQDYFEFDDVKGEKSDQNKDNKKLQQHLQKNEINSLKICKCPGQLPTVAYPELSSNDSIQLYIYLLVELNIFIKYDAKHLPDFIKYEITTHIRSICYFGPYFTLNQLLLNFITNQNIVYKKREVFKSLKDNTKESFDSMENLIIFMKHFSSIFLCFIEIEHQSDLISQLANQYKQQVQNKEISDNIHTKFLIYVNVYMLPLIDIKNIHAMNSDLYLNDKDSELLQQTLNKIKEKFSKAFNDQNFMYLLTPQLVYQMIFKLVQCNQFVTKQDKEMNIYQDFIKKILGFLRLYSVQNQEYFAFFELQNQKGQVSSQNKNDETDNLSSNQINKHDLVLYPNFDLYYYHFQFRNNQMNLEQRKYIDNPNEKIQYEKQRHRHTMQNLQKSYNQQFISSIPQENPSNTYLLHQIINKLPPEVNDLLQIPCPPKMQNSIIINLISWNLLDQIPHFLSQKYPSPRNLSDQDFPNEINQVIISVCYQSKVQLNDKKTKSLQNNYIKSIQYLLDFTKEQSLIKIPNLFLFLVKYVHPSVSQIIFQKYGHPNIAKSFIDYHKANGPYQDFVSNFIVYFLNQRRKIDKEFQEKQIKQSSEFQQILEQLAPYIDKEQNGNCEVRHLFLGLKHHSIQVANCFPIQISEIQKVEKDIVYELLEFSEEIQEDKCYDYLQILQRAISRRQGFSKWLRKQQILLQFQQPIFDIRNEEVIQTYNQHISKNNDFNYLKKQVHWQKSFPENLSKKIQDCQTISGDCCMYINGVNNQDNQSIIYQLTLADLEGSFEILSLLVAVPSMLNTLKNQNNLRLFQGLELLPILPIITKNREQVINAYGHILAFAFTLLFKLKVVKPDTEESKKFLEWFQVETKNNWDAKTVIFAQSKVDLLIEIGQKREIEKMRLLQDRYKTFESLE